MDDIACLRENTQLAKANWEKFLDRLSARFPIGDRGPLNWYCQQGISFRPDGTISQSHTRHIKAFLQKHDMLNCEPRETPYDKGEITEILRRGTHSLRSDDAKVDRKAYRSICMELSYIAVASHPELLAVVGILSQYMQDPRQSHYHAVCKIPKYLRYALDKCTVYKPCDMQLRAAVDSDWAADKVLKERELYIHWRSDYYREV